MIIHCDHCGKEIPMDGSFRYEADRGEIFYFCNAVCLERASHLEPVQDPERDERGIGAGVPVDEARDEVP